MLALTSRLGLRRLVMCLGLLGLAGVITVAANYFISNSALMRRQAQADVAMELGRLALVLDTELLEARRAEKDFLLRHEERYVSLHAELGGKVRATIAAMEQKLDDGAVQQKVAAIGKGFDAYLQQFRRVAELQRKLGLNENSGLQGKLRESVHDIEKHLAGFEHKELTVLMLMMRRHEKDFMLRHDARYLDDMKKRAAEFGKALAAAEIGKVAAEGIAAKMADYHKDFLAFATSESEKADATKSLSQSYATIEPLIDEVRTTFRGRHEEALADIAAQRSWTSMLMLASVALVIALVCAVGLAVMRAISRPIVGLATATQRLSEGDFEVVIEGATRRDEIGAMARAMAVFKDALIAKKAADEAAAQDADAKMRRAQKLDDLTRRFEANVSTLTQGLAAAATEMEHTAQAMTGTADQTNSQSVSVAGAAEQTSANVQTVAVATEELSSSIREIAEQVAKSSSIASRAADEARRTNDTVQALAGGAQKIGDVVALISNIAAQTNLLALNATIEAARAGEAGRGVAGVASEVKELAGQTARATEEIAAQIATIQQETNHAVDAIQAIGGTIDEMNAIAAGVAAAMEEQGAATGEIARNVQQAAQGTQAVTGSILDVKRGAGETGAAAAQVLGAAQELARHSEDLGREVDSFLSGVKAA
jgi:methyl-accepting chemotaxis protein